MWYSSSIDSSVQVTTKIVITAHTMMYSSVRKNVKTGTTNVVGWRVSASAAYSMSWTAARMRLRIEMTRIRRMSVKRVTTEADAMMRCMLVSSASMRASASTA